MVSGLASDFFRIPHLPLFAQQMTESSDANIPSKSWVLEEISIAYAEAGQYDKALQLSQSLPDRSLSQLFVCAKRSP